MKVAQSKLPYLLLEIHSVDHHVSGSLCFESLAPKFSSSKEYVVLSTFTTEFKEFSGLTRLSRALDLEFR